MHGNSHGWVGAGGILAVALAISAVVGCSLLNPPLPTPTAATTPKGPPPSTPTAPSATPTPGPTVAETTPGPTTTAATASPSQEPSQTLPGAIIFAPFSVTGDRTISHCEHVYDVLFTIQDSNGLTTFYAGQPATYQLLDGGDVLNGVVADNGTLTATVDEVFVQEPSSCHSRLAPKMLTVGDQPVFGA